MGKLFSAHPLISRKCLTPPGNAMPQQHTSQDLKQKLIALVANDLNRIETALKENLTPHIDLVSDIAGHLLFSGGKRLRPLLMLQCARICGFDDDTSALPVSTLFEYLHAATLLHDDVVDGARVRRGKSAAHTQWSPAKVVLTGDYLLARSMRLAAATGIPALIDVMANITEEMSQGEIDQMNKAGKTDLTEAEYLEIIRRKTAVLLQGACRSGAILAHADPEKEKALDRYGHHLGIAFQMADDLLDYTADAETLGKKTGADLREGKLTLPLIHALKKATPDDRKFMEEMIQTPDFNTDRFNDMVNKITRYDGIAYTSQMAQFHIDTALATLDLFESCQAKTVLTTIARYAVARNV